MRLSWMNSSAIRAPEGAETDRLATAERGCLYLSLLGLMLSLALLPQSAFAASSTSIATVLCEVAGWLYGPLGTSIAMLGIIVLGLMAMFGKIAIPNILIVLCGIAMIFGSKSILSGLGLSAGCSATDCSQLINNNTSNKLFVVFGCLTSWFTGNVGKTLATLAIVSLGIFAMNGRMSYHQAMIVSMGIAAVLSAGSIVATVGISCTTGQGPANFPIANICGQGGVMFQKIFCSLLAWFDGPVGKTLATACIVIMGIGAVYGKISWGMATVVSVGIAAVIGGGGIVQALGGDTVGMCRGFNFSTTNAFSKVLCNILSWVDGPVGKGLGTLGVIVLGLGALYGKMGWPAATVMALGIALMFGGAGVINAMGGNTDRMCGLATSPLPPKGIPPLKTPPRKLPLPIPPKIPPG